MLLLNIIQLVTCIHASTNKTQNLHVSCNMGIDLSEWIYSIKGLCKRLTPRSSKNYLIRSANINDPIFFPLQEPHENPSNNNTFPQNCARSSNSLYCKVNNINLPSLSSAGHYCLCTRTINKSFGFFIDRKPEISCYFCQFNQNVLNNLELISFRIQQNSKRTQYFGNKRTLRECELVSDKYYLNKDNDYYNSKVHRSCENQNQFEQRNSEIKEASLQSCNSRKQIISKDLNSKVKYASNLRETIPSVQRTNLSTNSISFSENVRRNNANLINQLVKLGAQINDHILRLSEYEAELDSNYSFKEFYFRSNINKINSESINMECLKNTRKTHQIQI